MRARRGLVVGWLLVIAYAVGLVVTVVTTSDGALRPGDRPDDGTAATAFVDAWERSRRATFVRAGTFERRSDETGAVIASDDVLAQRPPQRLHRQLGGVDGREDDQLVVCPAPPPDTPAAECRLGPPGGPTYAEAVAAEVAGLQAILAGPDPLYAVARGADAGCFELAQLRTDPRAPFGTEARFCFDASTGAPGASRVDYGGGIVEMIAVTEIRSDVTDADLRP
ncbi:MAG: hypothetical protein ABIP36_00690 [Acidimicrobiales bacterium]